MIEKPCVQIKRPERASRLLAQSVPILFVQETVEASAPKVLAALLLLRPLARLGYTAILQDVACPG